MILGIDGWAGVGKDTVADILVKEGFVKIAFADHLRESVVHATGLSMDLFLDRDTKDKPFNQPYKLSSEVIIKFCNYTGYSSKAQEVIDKYSGIELESPRHTLQFLGTEVGREMLEPMIWINGFKTKIQGYKNVVAPDARFSNERECIHELKGLVMWIDRLGVEPSENHKSGHDKWPREKYDLQIVNTGLFELKRGIRMWWSLKGHKL